MIPFNEAKSSGAEPTTVGTGVGSALAEGVGNGVTIGVGVGVGMVLAEGVGDAVETLTDG